MSNILLVFIVLISIVIGMFIGGLVIYRTLIVSMKEIYKVDDKDKNPYNYYNYTRPSREEYWRHIYKLPENETVKYEEKESAKSEISNLITDMIIRDASEFEINRAVRYSLIVMDSAKYNLDIKKAYKELQIEDLKIKYSK